MSLNVCTIGTGKTLVSDGPVVSVTARTWPTAVDGKIQTIITIGQNEFTMEHFCALIQYSLENTPLEVDDARYALVEVIKALRTEKTEDGKKRWCLVLD